MKTESKRSSNALWTKISMLLLCIPLIVKLVPYRLSEIEKTIYGYELYSDIFNLAKARVLLIVLSVTIILFLIDHINSKKTVTKHKVYILLTMYGLLTTASALFTNYDDIVYGGIIDRYEGLFVQLGYLLVTFLFVNYFAQGNNKSKVKNIIMCTTLFISLISLGQFWGFNILNWQPIKILLSNTAIAKQNEILVFNSEMAYGTLGNPNYLGAYYALVIPYLLYNYLQENRVDAINLGIILLSYGGVVASQSSAGIIGSILGIYVVLLLVKIEKNLTKYHLGLGMLTMAGLMILSSTIQSDIKLIALGGSSSVLLILMLSNCIDSMLKMIMKRYVWTIIGIVLFVSSLSYVATIQMKNEEFISNIEIHNTALEFESKEGLVTFDFSKDVVIRDFNQDIIEYTLNGNEVITDNPVLSALEVLIYSSSDGTELYLKRTGMLFEYSNGKLSYLNQFKKPVEIDQVERWDFEELGHVFSCRGYLWSTSLPLLKDHFFLGSGPDTFVFEYPAYDIKGKFNMFGTPHMIIDKPHNMFIQIGVQNGVLALLVFLSMIGYLYALGIKELKNKDSIESELWGFLAGISGYLLAAFFYDSSIGVSVVFWIFVAGVVSFEKSIDQ